MMSKRGIAAFLAACVCAAGFMLTAVSCNDSSKKGRENEQREERPGQKETASEQKEQKEEQSEPQVPVSATAPIDATHANSEPTDREAGKRALREAYPDCIKDITGNTITFTDGSTMVYDDGKAKDWNTFLDESDPEDMFFRPYTSTLGTPPYLYDPGRSRSEQLYKKMYGSSESQVRQRMRNVDWFGTKVQFSKINGAADSLSKVAKELENYPQLRQYLSSSGTFNWRPVRGAKRMSAHSYGTAFDVAVKYSDYWQWTNKTNDELTRIRYANKIPRQLVEIFERHGFIWGGAWYHYDTMHFEFRPELLLYAKYTKQ